MYQNFSTSPIQKKLTFENPSFTTSFDPFYGTPNDNSVVVNLEEILILEELLNSIITNIMQNLKCDEECFSWWNFYTNSSLCNSFQSYFVNEEAKEIVQLNTNIELLSVIICYDLSFSNDIYLKLSSYLAEIMRLHHINLILISKYILSKIITPRNEWIVKLENLTLNYGTRSPPNQVTREIKANLTNVINIQRVILKNYDNKSSIIEEITYFYKNIQHVTVDSINKFIREKVIRFMNKNGSVLASSAMKNENRLEIKVPYLNKESLKKYTLVLDLDETLIHFKEDPVDDSKGLLQFRPGLLEFLEKVGYYYEIVVFTAGTKDYADQIIDEIEQNKIYFDYRLYREHAVIVKGDFVKDISKLGRDMNRTIIVDNMPQSFALQKENGVYIRPFWGKDPKDSALIHLMPILINIAKEGWDVPSALKFYKNEIINKVTANLS